MEAYLTDTLCDLAPSNAMELDRLLSSYRVFRVTYCYDPVAFIHDCIAWPDGMGPAPYQDEVLDLLVEKKRVCVRSSHGAGKTTIAALAMLWFSLTRDIDEDWKLPATASAWRQLSKYLLPELRLWARRLRWDKIGRDPFCSRTEMLSLSLKLQTGEAFAVASDTPDRIEGSHAHSMGLVYDEAKAIPDATWDALEGAFASAGSDTSAEAYALAISTPGPPQGRFYDIHSRKAGYEDWHVRHITLEEAISAGRISADWAEQRRKQWGEHSAVYQNRVLGEFAAGEEDSVIPLAWVEAANERWLSWQDAKFPGTFTNLGVDVGGGGLGGDPSVLALVYDGCKVRELRRYPKGEPNTATMELVGRIVGILDSYGGAAYVDVVGIGTGVVHRLGELGKDVRPFNSSSGTEMTDVSGELGFKNWRAAGWWILREMLDPMNNIPVCLPPDDTLTGDLTGPQSKPISVGKIIIEEKKHTKERLKRSPDDGDAVVYGLVGPALWDELQRRGAPEWGKVVYEPIPIGVDW